MCHVLLHHENEIHAKGWDKDPQLFALCGPGLEPNGWTVEALMTDPWFWRLGHHPRDIMRVYADFLTLPDFGSARFGPGVRQFAANRDVIIDGLANGPLHALVFVCETYSLISTSDDNDRYKYRSIGDNPNAHESRNVIAVAPDSTVYVLNRIRGRQPYVNWTNHRTGAHGTVNGSFVPPELAGRDKVSFETSGGMIRSMRRIVNVVNARAGIPLIKHVNDNCNRCGQSVPVTRAGELSETNCPKCGNGG